MTELTNNHFAVEVPEGAINIIIDMGYIIWKAPNYKNWVNNDILSDYGKLSKYLQTHKEEDDYKTGGMPLPPGNWQIVCTSKEATEAIAAQIVEKDSEFFKCYAGNRSHISPLRSLFCLMGEKGCSLVNKTYLIIKKQ